MVGCTWLFQRSRNRLDESNNRRASRNTVEQEDASFMFVSINGHDDPSVAWAYFPLLSKNDVVGSHATYADLFVADKHDDLYISRVFA